MKGTSGTAEVVGQGVQTGTVQRISKPDMKLSPSTTGNGVEEIIATQAGVSTHNELSSQYNVSNAVNFETSRLPFNLHDVHFIPVSPDNKKVCPLSTQTWLRV